MSDRGLTTRGLSFGEHYSDGSGWDWRISLVTPDRGDEGPYVEIERVDNVRFDIASYSIRSLAKALNAIADELGEDD